MKDYMTWWRKYINNLEKLLVNTLHEDEFESDENDDMIIEQLWAITEGLA